MADPHDTLDLWDYRRRVAEMYRDVRRAGDGEAAWSGWRRARDELFATHPQSPLDPDAPATIEGLPMFPHDPSLRVTATVHRLDGDHVDLSHSGAGSTGFRRFGVTRFALAGVDLELTLYWLDTYGGGVFLPFRDLTSGGETYGGGRYLLDTAKGADLGHEGRRLVLDFNYAYHPSCVHSQRWSCPLSPPENRLDVHVMGGERLRSKRPV
jgi:uncharacterized protein (DUF1684 family)